MKIIVANDHGAVNLKKSIVAYLDGRGIEVIDFGANSEESVDYPDYAAKACQAFLDGAADSAILCCGTGIGMSITANKFPGIRAAVVSEPFSAKVTKEHNNSNVLCLGERVVGSGEEALKLVELWLDADFEGGRHQNRVEKIAKVEESLAQKD